VKIHLHYPASKKENYVTIQKTRVRVVADNGDRKSLTALTALTGPLTERIKTNGK
jgi:hypothetical protein